MTPTLNKILTATVVIIFASAIIGIAVLIYKYSFWFKNWCQCFILL